MDKSSWYDASYVTLSKDNIRIVLRETGWKVVPQDTDQWQALINTVMKLRVS
jgi:hypothetical protein